MSNTFTDKEGETFDVREYAEYGEVYLELRSNAMQAISFYKADAAKIIALIAEAAK